MERESNPMQAFCRSGCGFYGSPSTDGLCSLCYKEALKKKQQLPSTPTSLSALRDTTTAHPTINHVSSSPVTDLPAQDINNLMAFIMRNNINDDNADDNDDDDESSIIEKDKQSDNHLKFEALDEAAASTNTTGTTTTTTNNDVTTTTVAESTTGTTDVDNSSDDKEGDKDAKKKKNRCATCRKKVGLTGFECRCGGLFCAVHRYSDKHDCSFNYREMGAQEIRRNNPVVVGEKIQKI